MKTCVSFDLEMHSSYEEPMIGQSYVPDCSDLILSKDIGLFLFAITPTMAFVHCINFRWKYYDNLYHILNTHLFIKLLFFIHCK
jgi:uncharacterized membrane protein